MSKSESGLAGGEMRLIAWRVGMKLGSAIDRHRQAHWHLRQKDAAPAGKTLKPDIHLPTALANEVGTQIKTRRCAGPMQVNSSERVEKVASRGAACI